MGDLRAIIWLYSLIKILEEVRTDKEAAKISIGQCNITTAITFELAEKLATNQTGLIRCV